MYFANRIESGWRLFDCPVSHALFKVALYPFLYHYMYFFAADLNRLNEKLTETEKVKMELQLKLDDVQSSEASAQVCKKCFNLANWIKVSILLHI